MARLRYVKTPEQIAEAAASIENLTSTVQSLKAVYATDAVLARAVLPKPLKPTADPYVTAVISQLTIHFGGGIEFPLGAATFGVGAIHEGVEGIYQITMPMNNEVAVVSGRETYGEPKKLAEIELTRDGNEVAGRVVRMGMPYLELRGTVAEDLGPRKYTTLSYVFKALPSPEKGK
ncbi:MAG: acetoacetate decarboxylase family protein, partial [Myxococcales bacterium]|nr:acetoacetate decarboxylase family protein [Myxococcales bacterium]